MGGYALALPGGGELLEYADERCGVGDGVRLAVQLRGRADDADRDSLFALGVVPRVCDTECGVRSDHLLFHR